MCVGEATPPGPGIGPGPVALALSAGRAVFRSEDEVCSDVAPRRRSAPQRPASRVKRQPFASHTGRAGWWSKAGAQSLAAGGSAIHSCAACSRRSPGSDSSVWEMQCPAVIRFSSPGRTMACEPTLSRCSISPSNSQLTVCNPVCDDCLSPGSEHNSGWELVPSGGSVTYALNRRCERSPATIRRCQTLFTSSTRTR